MSTGVGLVPLVPRVRMSISYSWGGKTQCDNEQIKEEKRVKTVIDLINIYSSWSYLRFMLPTI